MLGAIMPAPLAMPATWTVRPPMRHEAAAVLGPLSVVMMAWAASWKASSDKAAAAAAMPRRILSMGSGTPMMPVEEGSTCRASMPTCPAVSAHMASASRSPPGPVQALALPLLTTTA